MKRLLLAILLSFGAAAFHSDTASARHPHPFGFGFQPFGFYQPYGAQFGTTLRTPPYFATNPPVYYGARHARPYGISPFASPPQVHAPVTYTARLRSKFSSGRSGDCCNPYVHHTAGPAATAVAEPGKVRRNPYVDAADESQADADGA